MDWVDFYAVEMLVVGREAYEKSANEQLISPKF